MSFRTQAPELLQQTAAENAERPVDLTGIPHTSFHSIFWMSFRTQAPELLQQTAAENAERPVDLEDAGAFFFVIHFF